MKNFEMGILGAACLLFFAIVPLWAQTENSSPKSPATKPAEPETKEPKPPRKVGIRSVSGYKGSTSGPITASTHAVTRSGKLPATVRALTPGNVGLTYSSQPSFFWYQSDASEVAMIFILEDLQNNKKGPLLKLVVDKDDDAFSAGVHRLNLSDFDVNLEPGKLYRWTITYVIDPDSPSLNAYSKATVKRVPIPGDLVDTIENGDIIEKIDVLAKNGIWHDLFALVEELRAEDPDNPEIAAYRRTLISDIGLGDKVPKDM